MNTNSNNTETAEQGTTHDLQDQVLLAATNLRDQGGYPTEDGRRIRTGLLYRGGHMSELDDDGLGIYRSLGLSTIVDLRRNDEVEHRPTPVFGDETNLHLSVSDGDSAFAQMAGYLEDPEAAAMIIEAGAGYYGRLVSDRLDRFRPVFQALLDPDQLPALFHCTAGKDRTGFTGATILKWLGVPDNVIMADFLLSNETRRPFAERRALELRQDLAKKRNIRPEDVPARELDAFRTLLSVDRSYLQAVYNAVESIYGDWHNMRRDGLGIDDASFERFSAFVLE